MGGRWGEEKRMRAVALVGGVEGEGGEHAAVRVRGRGCGRKREGNTLLSVCLVGVVGGRGRGSI